MRDDAPGAERTSNDGRRLRPLTPADRVVYPLLAWAACVTVLEIPVLFVLWHTSLVRSMQPYASWFLVHPILLDLCSAYLATIRRLRGRGMSGVGLLSWLCYAQISLFGFPVVWWLRFLLLGALTALHIACQYRVPETIARGLGWQGWSDRAVAKPNGEDTHAPTHRRR